MLCEKWTVDTYIKERFYSLSCEKPEGLYFIVMEVPMRCFFVISIFTVPLGQHLLLQKVSQHLKSEVKNLLQGL